MAATSTVNIEGDCLGLYELGSAQLCKLSNEEHSKVCVWGEGGLKRINGRWSNKQR